MIFLLILSVLFFPLIRKQRLFSFQEEQRALFPLITPFIALLSFVVILTFLPLLGDKIIEYLKTHGFIALEPRVTGAFLHMGCAAAAFFALLVLCWMHPKNVRKAIFGQLQPKLFFQGVWIAVLCYPMLVLLSQVLQFILSFWFPIGEEQVALIELRRVFDVPWLFWIVSAGLVTIVPLVEELLFRGFIQNFFVQIFGTTKGIFTSSLIFALFHYAPIQGAANILIITALFFFSCVVGSVYVTRKSFLSAVGVHAGFNACTLLFFLLQEKLQN